MADNDIIHVLDEFLEDMDKLEYQQGSIPLTRHQKVSNMTNVRNKTIPSWLRRKQDLMALRLESQGLETRVQFLESQQDKRRRGLKISPKQLEKLQCLADKEKRRRQQAEQENEALKCQVQAYIRLSTEFQAAVNAHNGQSTLNDTIPTMVFCAAMEKGYIHQLQISSISTFNVLEERIDNRFQSVKLTLDEIQHSSVALDEEQVQFDIGKSVMEYKCARNATLNAAWSIVEESGATQKQVSHVVRRSNDAYAVDSRFAMSLDYGELVTVDKLPQSGQRIMELQLYRVETRASQCGQVKAVARSEVVRLQVAPDTKCVCTHDRVILSFRELIDSQRQFLENTLWDSTRNITT
ncbi:hypothetical protein PHMEG_00037135 [Phytophthora megakarya]|uniref:Uncharacterized protein n=1 Tax=Phytophthora megakarya TaxID=4795 RepID=A0A225ULP3_9STRA|nr:hypothetical protein PHMEG_00037135 [Phytophthora megakarya]